MDQRRKVVDVLKGGTVFPPPLWMMRQAGRYLPEYRETRKRAGGFLDLCYTPELAAEVTLQPIERFGFDAAILFSDILVVPHALGRDLRFDEGHGPRMNPIAAHEIERLGNVDTMPTLAAVYEAVRLIRSRLPGETTLLGFCGAPWTVATYMIAGHGTPDQAPARLFAYRQPEAFEKLLDILAEASADHLIRQIDAGADAVQIFDSWSGVLDEVSFETFCARPVRQIVQRVKQACPEVPIIGFPKGAGANLNGYRTRTGVDALGLDWCVPLGFARQLQSEGPVQGNLDPLRLVAGGRALDEGVDAIVRGLGNGPLVFNLGHGITPDAPLRNVERMIERVQNSGG